jgi:hypothetical protein
MNWILAASDSTGGAGSMGGVIGGVAAVAITGWLVKKVSTLGAESQGDVSVLRHHRSYPIIGWICVVMFGGAAVASQFAGENLGMRMIYLGIFGGFALLGLLLVAMYHRCRLSWQADALTYCGLFGSPFQFTWTEVEKVKFSGTAQWWKIILRDGRKVRVGVLMPGAIEFMRAVARRSGVAVPPACPSNGQRVEIS